MEPKVAKLGHVAYRTPDLEETAWFFEELMGLQAAERTEDAVYLRGLRDWEHHTMSLRAGGEAGVEHVAFRTEEPEHVEAFGTRFEGQGLDVEWLDPGRRPRGRRVGARRRPGRSPVPVLLRRREARGPQGSSLPPAQPSVQPGGREPRRLSAHRPRPRARRRWRPLADWFTDELDFRTNERFQSEDGSFWGWWLSRTALPHDIGIHKNEDGPSFHHVSYHVDHLRDLWDAADICREHGIAPDGGPGKHAITNADFFYVIEPASGIRIELFAGPGYLNFEPDWEPIDWQPDDIGTELDHQWIGTQYSEDSIPYVER
ncbi:MAG: VOC family protein [Halobacteriales archaeon]|nr:VOC family protein [Halobacteriales archaeon]